MNTFILHQPHKCQVHTTVSKVLSNCLIYQQAQLERPHFVSLSKNFSIHVMSVRSTTVLTRELNPLEAPFLPTDDPRFLWLKYQILMFFEDRLKNIEIRPEVHEKSEKQKMFL